MAAPAWPAAAATQNGEGRALIARAAACLAPAGKGYDSDDDTWEPLENLGNAEAAIALFESARASEAAASVPDRKTQAAAQAAPSKKAAAQGGAGPAAHVQCLRNPRCSRPKGHRGHCRLPAEVRAANRQARLMLDNSGGGGGGGGGGGSDGDDDDSNGGEQPGAAPTSERLRKRTQRANYRDDDSESSSGAEGAGRGGKRRRKKRTHDSVRCMPSRLPSSSPGTRGDRVPSANWHRTTTARLMGWIMKGSRATTTHQ
jgi:pyruvate/2-oxoglutarate dehydrogenase complex dihydrolipoamide acyltransferase (E2) component